MKIAIGSDHAGFAEKFQIINFLKKIGHVVVDCGTYDLTRTHYPIYGITVGMLVAQKKVDRGIVICGTGIGISNSANKVAGVRCVLARDYYTIKKAREQMDANVVAFGTRVVGIGFIIDGIKVFLETKATHKNDNQIMAINNKKKKIFSTKIFKKIIEDWEKGKYTENKMQSKIPLPKILW